MRITFNVLVNDHEKVAFGSTHWIGVGMEAGEKVLWVEQHGIVINKVQQINFFSQYFKEETINIYYVMKSPFPLLRMYMV